MSSMTVCANGTMNAPATPWNNRNATISGRVVAMPHNMDAMTNRTTEKRKRLRDPTLSASQPVTGIAMRSEEHTSELQSLMRISYAVFCLKKKIKIQQQTTHVNTID